MRAAERRFLRIYEIGCIACRARGWFTVPCEAHHLNLDEHAGQPRLGDEATIGLCPWHHRGVPLGFLYARECERLLGPSLAREPVRFREVFGSDARLLEIENELIARTERRVVGRMVA